MDAIPHYELTRLLKRNGHRFYTKNARGEKVIDFDQLALWVQENTLGIMTLNSLDQLAKAIRALPPGGMALSRDPLYKTLKAELTPLGFWKLRRRGKADTNYFAGKDAVHNGDNY